MSIDLDAIRARWPVATLCPFVSPSTGHRCTLPVGHPHPVHICEEPAPHAPADIAALLAEVDRLREEGACPYVVTSAEGASYCTLGEAHGALVSGLRASLERANQEVVALRAERPLAAEDAFAALLPDGWALEAHADGRGLVAGPDVAGAGGHHPRVAVEGRDLREVVVGMTGMISHAWTLIDHVAALVAERDRLRAILDAETGKRAPAGWTKRIRDDAVRWVRDGSERPGRMCDAVQRRNSARECIEWHWWDRDIDIDGEVGTTHAEGFAPSALEAMEQADRAAGGGA